MNNSQVIAELAALTDNIENTVDELNKVPYNKYCPELITELCENLEDVKQRILLHYLNP